MNHIKKLIFIVALINTILLQNTVVSLAIEKKVPIYSVDRNDNKIALTFNCAWGDEDIQSILQILQDAEINCTFFIVGDFARRCPAAVKLIYEAGHEIANHSDTHKNMTIISQEEVIKEITSCNQEIFKLTGFTPELFRAPSGSYDNKTISAAEYLNMYSIQWDVDSLDWKGLSAEDIISRVKSRTKSGSIILMHTGTRNTVNSLNNLLKELNSFTFVTVGDLIFKSDYSVNPINGIQIKNK